MIAKASDGAAIRIVFQGAGCASGLRSKNFESEMKGENTTDERPIFNNCDAEKTAEGKDSQRAGGGSDPVHAGGRCGGGAEKQAAAGSTAQYGGSAAGTKAVDGNKQRSLYGSAATVPYKDTATATYNNAASPSYSGNTASLYSGAVSTPYTGTVTAQYKSPEARPAVRSPNATPYGGAATAQYNSPAAAKPAVRKREKTPSELGDEVVARVLVEEGLMDPKDLEEYLASFEEPSARTFTDAGGSNIMGRGTNKLYSRQRDNGLVSPVQISGGNTGPIDPPPEWLAQMPMQDPDYPGLAAAANQAGFWLKDNKEWLAPEWLELMSMSNSDYPGLPAAANQAGFWLKDNAEWLAPE